jgi:hypothetical protein
VKPLFWSLILASLAAALCAPWLGGGTGAGVLLGACSGLGLGAGIALAERRLLATRPERAFDGLLAGFLVKLLALLAVAAVFRGRESAGMPAAPFLLAFLGALLLATGAARLGAPYRRSAGEACR